MKKPDKYAHIKEEICAIYHENQGRYGYRRITMELHKRGYQANHKTVQRLMKILQLKCMVRLKKYRSYKEGTVLSACRKSRHAEGLLKNEGIFRENICVGVRWYGSQIFSWKTGNRAGFSMIPRTV